MFVTLGAPWGAPEEGLAAGEPIPIPHIAWSLFFGAFCSIFGGRPRRLELNRRHSCRKGFRLFCFVLQFTFRVFYSALSPGSGRSLWSVTIVKAITRGAGQGQMAYTWSDLNER